VPGEAGGDPHGDDVHVPPAVPLLHQHAARPHLPLDLPAAGAAGGITVAAAAAGGGGSAAALGGAPPEQLLRVPQLDHLRNDGELASSFLQCVAASNGVQSRMPVWP
jgi:hypothetical protein